MVSPERYPGRALHSAFDPNNKLEIIFLTLLIDQK